MGQAGKETERDSSRLGIRLGVRLGGRSWERDREGEAGRGTEQVA